jgi:hypothetical protein
MPHDDPGHGDPGHRAMHDLGGHEHWQFAASEHAPSDFDKGVDALVNLLALRETGLVRPDERRRGIEELPQDVYFNAPYYERWLLGVTAILIEKGLLSEAEIAAEMARLEAEAPDIEGDG